MKAIRSSHMWFASLLGLALLTSVACTQVMSATPVMLSPVGVATDISTYPNETISVTNMINHSGVVTPFTNGVTFFDEYFADPFHTYASPGSGGTNNWQSDGTSDPGIYQGHIYFDLGAVYQINKLAIWNKSLSNVTVKVLVDLGGPEQVVGDFTLGNYQNYFDQYGAEILPFGGSYIGRYVRLEINSVHPLQGLGFSYGYSIVGEVVASALPVGPISPSVNALRNPDGSVTVMFTGALQTSTTASGTFTNVPGNPLSPHTLPKASLLPEQYFRAQGN